MQFISDVELMEHLYSHLLDAGMLPSEEELEEITMAVFDYLDGKGVIEWRLMDD